MMRSLFFGFALAVSLGTLLAPGCAASDSGGPAGSAASGGSGGSGNSDGSAATGGLTTGGTDGGGGTAGFNPDASCLDFTAEAKQASAAMLFVVDGSASMSQAGKWSTAQQATVAAIDKDAFDNMQLGLVRFPATYVDPPQCFCDYVCAGLGGCDIATCKLFLGQPGVACGISGLPQVPLADSGTQKSNSGGVRQAIYNYLVQNTPFVDSSDASPIYDALVSGYNALANAGVERRILVLFTDGGFSCTSLSVPTRPGYSDGACPDWEEPDTVNALISGKRDDASAPIYTFIVGVPGSDSTGAQQGAYATAPYNMRLALSTYAVSGVPAQYLPAGCDSSVTFSQTGAAPTSPCHFDLSQTTNFDANKLADTIAQIRGNALGCEYDLPAAPAGKTVDTGKVNVVITLDGTQTEIPKRSQGSTDPCTADYCWDYNADTTKVEIIGKACDDIGKAAQAKVEIYVGCTTVIK